MRKHPCHDPTRRLDERQREQQSESDEQIAREAAETYRRTWLCAMTPYAIDQLTSAILSAITRAHKERDEQSAPAAEQEWHKAFCPAFNNDNATICDCGFRSPPPAQEKQVEASVEEIVQKWAKRYAANDPSLDYVEDAIRNAVTEALATASSKDTTEVIDAAEAMIRYIDRNWPGARSTRLPVQRLRAALATASPSEDTKPIAWLHRLTGEGLIIRKQFTFTQESPFGVAGKDYSSTFTAIKTPLYAAMSSPSVTQTETKTSLSATTQVAGEQQRKETDGGSR